MRLALTFLLVALPAGAATYYVSTNGLDTNPGTEGEPFLTVQKGLNTAVPTDTILVGSGAFTNDAQTARSGTNGGRITLNGQGIASMRTLLMLHAYVDVQNMTFTDNTNANGRFVYMDVGADNCTFSNNTFDGEYASTVRGMTWNASGSPPFGNAGSGNLIISNLFYRIAGAPVINCYGDTNVFWGNRILDGDAIDAFVVAGRSNLVAANLVSNVFISGLSGNHPDFFQAFGGNAYGAYATIIESNTVIKMDGESQICMFEGQNTDEVKDFTFRNNLFIGVSAKGTMACRDVKWFNNVFFKCSTNATTGGSVLNFTTATNETYTNFVFNSAHGSQLMNNVFIDCGDGSTNKNMYGFDNWLTNVAADYNQVSCSNYNAIIYDVSERPVGDPGGWDKFYWYEPNGINGGDPLFVSEANGNFHLLANSPLIGAATNLNTLFTLDLDGVTRGNEWDIGAYEYEAQASPPIVLRITGRVNLRGKVVGQ